MTLVAVSRNKVYNNGLASCAMNSSMVALLGHIDSPIVRVLRERLLATSEAGKYFPLLDKLNRFHILLHDNNPVSLEEYDWRAMNLELCKIGSKIPAYGKYGSIGDVVELLFEAVFDTDLVVEGYRKNGVPHVPRERPATFMSKWSWTISSPTFTEESFDAKVPEYTCVALITGMGSHHFVVYIRAAPERWLRCDGLQHGTGSAYVNDKHIMSEINRPIANDKICYKLLVRSDLIAGFMDVQPEIPAACEQAALQVF